MLEDGDIASVRFSDLSSINLDRTTRRRLEACQEIKYSGFTTSREPQKADKLTLFYLKTHIFKHMNSIAFSICLTTGIVFGNIFHIDVCHSVLVLSFQIFP